MDERRQSKWENAKSLPDASVMLELCEILGITVNELLSGERMEMDKYKEEAEKNLGETLKTVEKILNENKMLKVALTMFLIAIAYILYYHLGVGVGKFIYNVTH